MDTQTEIANKQADTISSIILDRIKTNNLDIPLLPDVANRVVRLTQDNESSAQALAQLVQSDQTLAAHIIRVANSATYSPNSSIVSMQQAITRLGLNTIGEIALATSVNASLFHAPGFNSEIDDYLISSLKSALWSKEVARSCRKNVEAAFLGGLLSDIGKPMILHTAFEVCEKENITLDKHFADILTKKFARLMSSRLVSAWEMPLSVQHVIIYFDKYDQEHEHAMQTHIAVAGTTLANYYNGTNEHTTQIKEHPIFGLLNLYEDEIDTLFEKYDNILQTVETMRT